MDLGAPLLSIRGRSRAAATSRKAAETLAPRLLSSEATNALGGRRMRIPPVFAPDIAVALLRPTKNDGVGTAFSALFFAPVGSGA